MKDPVIQDRDPGDEQPDYESTLEEMKQEIYAHVVREILDDESKPRGNEFNSAFG